MAFEKLKFKKVSNQHMLENSYAFYDSIIRRRTVREFSDEEVPIEVIYNAIKIKSSLINKVLRYLEQEWLESCLKYFEELTESYRKK